MLRQFLTLFYMDGLFLHPSLHGRKAHYWLTTKISDLLHDAVTRYRKQVSLETFRLLARHSTNWATPPLHLLLAVLPLKGRGITLSVLPKNTKANLLACPPHYPFNAERQTGTLWIPTFLRLLV